MTGTSAQPQAISSLVWIATAIAVIARFAIRELLERKISVARLFLAPGFLAIVAVFFVAGSTTLAPHGSFALAIGVAVGLAIGGGVGFGVAAFTTARIDGASDTVYVRGSYATLAIWLAAFAARALARFAVGTHDLGTTAIANAALIVLLAAAMIVVRYRLFLAVRRLRAYTVTGAIIAR